LTGFGLPSATSSVFPDFHHREDKETWQSVVDFAGEVHTQGIGVGDILYIPTPGKEHVALIVGWGPLLKTWQILHMFNEIRYDYSISLSRTYQDGYVPYVVDHGTQRQTADQSLSRPYYFLNWSPTFTGSTDFHEVSEWRFQKLPDVVCKPSNDVITLQEGMTRVERT
jgi:hypothetical protein